MAVSKYYKIVNPATLDTYTTDNQNVTGQNSYTNTSWYHNIIYGSSYRLARYNEYDVMDADVDIARALDVIAEEMCGNRPKDDLPLEIKITSGPEKRMTSTELVTLKAALKTWCKMHDWDNRLFSTARNLIKYGDVFFLRPKTLGKKYVYVHPKDVTGAYVSESDITDVLGWEIKSTINTSHGGLYSQTFNNIKGVEESNYGISVGSVRLKAKDVVRFTLYSDMSEEAPFGVSILKAVYTTFKQKQLLEDAVIIYRIQRAPERRAFYIDTQNLPPHMVPMHLEMIKNEIRQKRIPNLTGGQAQVDALYNPQSMNEDFFFAVRGDGGGSRVEVLPGGQNLGELQDLDYWYKKLLRGLRIPESYMNNSAEGSSPASDGKVGIAYQQEIKFTLYVERLQKALEKTLDEEFKQFLHDIKIKVDTTAFEIRLPAPTSYKESREQSINADLLNNFSTADGIDFISKRFAAIKYLGWSQEDIILNERLKREELGLSPQGGPRDLPMVYNPEVAESRGFDGGISRSSGGGSTSLSPRDFFSDAEDETDINSDSPDNNETATDNENDVDTEQNQQNDK